MASPVAVGLGPIETIVNVAWPSLPVYVCFMAHADRSGIGASQPPAHTATIELTPAAVKAGATIVLDVYKQQSFFGDPQMFQLTVIRVPRFVNGKLFTATLAGTVHTRVSTTPDYFCGNYHYEDKLAFVGEEQRLDSNGNTFVLQKYTHTWLSSNPDGVYASGTETVYYAGHEPEHDSVLDEFFLSYYDAGELTNTGLPCDTPITPGFKIEMFPFDITLQVNAIKDHVVTDPGYPYDPTDAVRTAAQFGDRTCIWQTFLTSEFNPIVSGIGDGVIDFDMRKSLFSTKRKDKIIEIFPSASTARGVRYDAFGWPRIRINKPVPSIIAPPTASVFPWSDVRAGNVRLNAGGGPPVVDFDPFVPA
jgi:hypothetical protein